MYLSVQGAALRLGVSPHTIRRWTASGFLPCTRTAGGHRRIKREDIDELAHLIGGRNHLAARLACEREQDSLIEAVVLLGDDPDPSALFPDLARHVAGLLDAHRCVISASDPRTGRLETRAVWDLSGGGSTATTAADLARRPLLRAALDERRVMVVNASDPRGEPAEVALLRRDGDRSIVLVPVVRDGRAVGLLEVLDHKRERRLGRHELRLAQAAAAQAAVALRGAAARDTLRRHDEEVLVLRRAVERITEGQAELAGQASAPAVLRAAAALATRALGGLTCVASRGTESAGAADAGAAALHQAAAGAAHVLVASAPSPGGKLTLTLTLGRPPGPGEAELLTLVAAIAASALEI